MKLIFTCVVIFTCSQIFSHTMPHGFLYVDPIPNAKLVNQETSIILKADQSFIDITTLSAPGSVTVTGSKSGICNFEIVRSDSNILFKPVKSFSIAETVTVNLTEKIKRLNGSPIIPESYCFYIEHDLLGRERLAEIFNNIRRSELPAGEINYINDNTPPEIEVTYNSFPSPGKIFISNIVSSPLIENTPYLAVYDNYGNIVFSRQMDAACYDFRRLHNNMLAYYDLLGEKYYAMDENYNVIDSFYTGNGYKTDFHELRLMDNGHALLMSYDPKVIDSTGGTDFNTTVIGLIIQEIDENKNVVFQWRSWDYFQITDATHENLTANQIDYVHGNAIEHDTDGNIIISSRNMDEITKINRSNGNIMWRLGGKNNQFTFTNDTIGFSHQHAIRRLKNGNIIMYDNGNFHNPPFSRAAEYSLDEVNKTVTLVWQYRHSPDIFAPFTGFAQRLANGNTFICWGYADIAATEVRYDGTKVFEFKLPSPKFSYRILRYEWKENTGDEISPKNYSLRQNYPNPFNPVTTIKFEIPKPEIANTYTRAVIVLYDVLGRNLGTLLDNTFPAGTYSIDFDAAKYPSGVYFYRLQAGNFSETRKMVLVK